MKKGNKRQRDPKEIVGRCNHRAHRGDSKITWEKARSQCIKLFYNKCRYFIAFERR